MSEVNFSYCKCRKTLYSLVHRHMNMSERKRLTESQIEELLLLYIGGASLRRVSRKIGCTQATVKYHVVKADMKVRSRESYFEGKPVVRGKRRV